MRVTFPLMLCVLMVSGCGVLDRLKPHPKPSPMVEVVPQTAVPAPVLGAGKTAAALDTTTVAQKKEALAAAHVASEQSLGKVAVALGSPAEPGFWLRTTLVNTPGKGRVETSAGESVAVDLLPGASGAQLSLAAFRALGLSLTALPEVTVYAR